MLQAAVFGICLAHHVPVTTGGVGCVKRVYVLPPDGRGDGSVTHKIVRSHFHHFLVKGGAVGVPAWTTCELLEDRKEVENFFFIIFQLNIRRFIGGWCGMLKRNLKVI